MQILGTQTKETGSAKALLARLAPNRTVDFPLTRYHQQCLGDLPR